MLCPSPLQSNDKAVIVSPAGKIDAELVHKAAAVLRAWGFRVDISLHALGQDGRFSASAESRLQDLQQAMDDPDVKLILCSRGGYGTVHLLHKLNFEGIKANPKWIIGFSDITALHATLQSHGITSVHGPMAKHFADEGADDISVKYLNNILSGKRLTYKIPTGEHAQLNRLGTARGRLFGGNLAVFCGLLGTKMLKIPRNGILFIEDIGEEPYKVDRFINQLKLAGVFNKISGMIVGQFIDYKEDAQMYAPLFESVSRAVSEYAFPVCFDFPAGHAKPNFPLFLGQYARLEVEKQQILFRQNCK